MLANRATRAWTRQRALQSRCMSSSREYFPTVSQVSYEGPNTTNPLAFRQYQADEVILGKSMRDWCRFSVCYWHTFCGVGLDPFGRGTLQQPWLIEAEGIADPVERAKMKADAAFEFFTKLGVDYYTFHDRDVVDEHMDLAETHRVLHVMQDYLQKKQEETGKKLLWGTANLFSHPRFQNGAGTNPDLNVFAHAGAQIRHAMDVTYALGGQNYVFWGGREGYMSILNTNLRTELDHMAALLGMAAEYRNKIGGKFQLLIEPKPREPTKHQYDYDAMTVIGFLKHYGLDKDFKLNVEPNHTTLAGHDYEHDIMMAAQCNMLGSIDCNTGDPLVGWDTDQFLMDEKKATLVMKTAIEMGGLEPGGLNFDCKVRRESTDPEDLFYAHIGSIDCFAKGLRNAAALVQDGELGRMLDDRYKSWNCDLGRRVEERKCSLEELDEYATASGYPKQESGKQELFEMAFQRGIEGRGQEKLKK